MNRSPKTRRGENVLMICVHYDYVGPTSVALSSSFDTTSLRLRLGVDASEEVLRRRDRPAGLLLRLMLSEYRRLPAGLS